jgi:tetratricopeptide (TPR) repeat protein
MNHDHHTAKQRIALGMNAWERGDYKGALEMFEGVLGKHPTFPDVHNKAGLCMAMLGDSEAALEEFERAIELAPTYAEAHLNRAIILNDLGRHEEAQQAFHEAGRLDSRHGNPFPGDVGNRIAITHAQVGDLYLVADHASRAIEQYRQALEIRPDFLDIRSKLAEALAETGEHEAARDELREVLGKNPNFTSARIRLGVVLQRMGDMKGAAREWMRAHSEDPTDMRPRAYLASIGVFLDEADRSQR